MSKNVIVSFSYKEDKIAVVDEFKKIASREGKAKSELLVELIEEYVKAHSSGNPSFTMDQFQDPGFQAVPTIYANREKWINHYKDSNREDRVKLNIKINDLQKVFKMIEVNENRK